MPGADARELLAEAGYSEAEFERMRVSGTFG